MVYIYPVSPKTFVNPYVIFFEIIFNVFPLNISYIVCHVDRQTIQEIFGEKSQEFIFHHITTVPSVVEEKNYEFSFNKFSFMLLIVWRLKRGKAIAKWRFPCGLYTMLFTQMAQMKIILVCAFAVGNRNVYNQK